MKILRTGLVGILSGGISLAWYPAIVKAQSHNLQIPLTIAEQNSATTQVIHSDTTELTPPQLSISQIDSSSTKNLQPTLITPDQRSAPPQLINSQTKEAVPPQPLVSESVNSPTSTHQETSVASSSSQAEASRVTVASPFTPVAEQPLAKPETIPQSSVISTPATEQSVKKPENAPQTSVKILSPTTDTVLDVPAVTVILQYPVGTQVELRVNDKAVDSSLVGRTETDATTNLVTQTWYGVSLQEGGNTISAQVVGNGVTQTLASVTVQVRGAPKQLKLETQEARIPADGRSTATVQGQLLDENGNRSNRDAVVTLETSAGEFVDADYDRNRPGFQAQAKQGQFVAHLRSGLEAKIVRIRATANDLEAFTQLQFETTLRTSLTTGVLNLRWGARGTDYFGSFRDFLPADNDNHNQLDVSGAAFATGRVGEWLFTGAFNSDRPINQDCNCNNRLFGTYQSSEKNYPVYGDSSTVTRTTPSTDNLYLRLERSAKIPGANPDYVMWGDYNTEEFATASQQFTAITRQLHGFKANYNLGNLQITGFYGNNVEGFQRDTIAPDGTSGYYFLSRRLLIAGSEDVFIELEELDRPGTVLKRERFSRGSDYDIDYDRGTLLFHKPLLRTDIDEEGRVLVRRIVATYQFESQEKDTNIYAGRVRYHFSRSINQESWVGATYLRENQGNRNFELYGADALISLGDRGRLIAEYAHSSNDSELLGHVSGSAYRIEVEGQITDDIKGRAYYRSADTGFSNDATVSFVPGQTRYGAQLQARLSSTTNVRLQYDHEDNQGVAPRPIESLSEFLNPLTEPIPGSAVDNSLTTISAGIQQRIGRATLEEDFIFRNREDRIAPYALSGSSSQLRSRLTWPITNTLTFRAQNELTLASSSQGDAVYPDRTALGLDWAVYPGIKVSLAHQWFTSGQYAGQSITSLGVTGDYKLGANTTLTGRYSIVGGMDGLTSEGAVGLNHRWNIAPGLHMDLAYEHVFGNFLGRTGAGTRFQQPFAFGQGASALGVGAGDSYSIGLEYTDNPNFKASARFEHRTSSQGSNTVISASATGQISPALTALFSYHQASAANINVRGLEGGSKAGLGTTVNLRLGLAYRDPNDDRFNALLRYEYRKNPATIPDSILLGSGTGSEEHVFSAEAIYAPNWQWEFYGKYAFRHSTSRLANDLVGTSTVSLAQLRATYRLGYNVDLVGEARWITQPSAGYNELGLLLEVGYWVTPNLRLAAGYSFGQVDDHDFSGSRSAGGPYVGLTVKLNDLFGSFGQPRIAPHQQQESSVNNLDVVGNVSE